MDGFGESLHYLKPFKDISVNTVPAKQNITKNCYIKLQSYKRSVGDCSLTVLSISISIYISHIRVCDVCMDIDIDK